jgi:photosystem II stability/assembly factor-like uncharacterized protein
MKIIQLLMLIAIHGCSTGHWVKTKTEIEDGLHDVEAINDEVALAYSYGTGKLFKTMDGGGTWDHIFQFDSLWFEQLQFINENTGWIAGSPNKLFRTEDGGNTWVDIAIKTEASSAIYGMYFRNLHQGYIALMDKGVTDIFFTSNGGDDWELVNSIDEMILNLEEINQTLYGTGNNVIIENIHLPDAWHYSFHDTLNQVGQIRDMTLSGNGKILAASFNGYVLTFDTDHWDTHQVTTNRLRCIISHGDYWIVAGDRMEDPGNFFASTDGGMTWEIPFDQLDDIHRFDVSNAKLWAVGKEGLIMTKKKNLKTKIK